MYKTVALTILLLGAASLSAQARKAATSTFPQIVARVSLRNQLANVPTTTIFTPAAAGLYRLSAYSVETVPVVGGSDNWSMAIFWTDDFGPESSSVLFTPNSGGWGSMGSGFPPGSVTIFRAMAGRPVKYTVELCQSCQGGTYSLYFVVEQLM